MHRTTSVSSMKNSMISVFQMDGTLLVTEQITGMFRKVSVQEVSPTRCSSHGVHNSVASLA